MISRRGLLGIFLAAPVVITTPGLLMPVRKIIIPQPTVLKLRHRLTGEEKTVAVYGDGLYSPMAEALRSIPRTEHKNYEFRLSNHPLIDIAQAHERRAPFLAVYRNVSIMAA